MELHQMIAQLALTALEAKDAQITHLREKVLQLTSDLKRAQDDRDAAREEEAILEQQAEQDRALIDTLTRQGTKQAQELATLTGEITIKEPIRENSDLQDRIEKLHELAYNRAEADDEQPEGILWRDEVARLNGEVLELRAELRNARFEQERLEALRAEHIAEIDALRAVPEQPRPYTTSLDLRERRTYRDGWGFLDSSRHLGTATVLQRSERRTDDEDPCEPTDIVMLVKVQVGEGIIATFDDVKQALRDTFGGSKCTHDHDCCGCWTTTFGDVFQSKVDTTEYVLLGSASRNH